MRSLLIRFSIFPKKANRTTPRLLLFIFVVFFSLYGIIYSAPVQSDSILAKKEWQVLESDGQLIRLTFVNPSTGFRVPDSRMDYVAIPKGKSTVILKKISFRTYTNETIFKETVSGTPSTLPIKTDSLVKLEPVGYVRDWRIGRLTLTLSQQSGNLHYVLDSVSLDIQPDKKMELTPYTKMPYRETSSNSFNHPPQPSIGIDAVLSDIIINYDPRSELRNLPDLPYNSPESYPGQVSPEFFGKNIPWVKLSIPEKGFYRISLEYLKSMGIKTGAIKPETFRLFNQGKEIPTQLDIQSHGKTNPNDGIIFYGEDPNSIYTNFNIYWLTWGKNSGLHFPIENISNTISTTANITKDYQIINHLEKKMIFEDWADSNPNSSGEWFWKAYSVLTSGKIRVDLSGMENIRLYQQKVPIEIQFHGKSKAEFSNEHRVIITWDRTTLGEAHWAGQVAYSFKTTLPTDYLTTGQHILRFNLPGTGSATKKDEIYLKSIQLTYYNGLSPQDGLLEFQRETSANNAVYFISGFADSADFDKYYIYALDTLHQIHLLHVTYNTVQNGFYLPAISVYQKYIIAQQTTMDITTPTPYSVKDNLRDTHQQADYIIITHPDFLKQAQELARYHKKQGLRVRIVDINDIYDQFGYGLFDPRAIHDFLQYALYFWNPPYPSYVLLIGDGTSDYKGDYHNGVINYIPPYRMNTVTEEAASDLWYTQIVGDDLLPDIICGRISVNNTTDAKNIVDKIIRYETQPEMGPWKNRILFVSDDGFEDDCRDVSRALPVQFSKEFVDLRDYPSIDNYYLPNGENSKISLEGNRAVLNAISEGDLAVIYFGHGSPNVWSHQRIFFGGDTKNSDMKKLKNDRKLPFVVQLTCSTGEFDWPTRPWNICISEDMQRVPQGGAIAVYSPTGKGFTPQHKNLTNKLVKAMFEYQQTVDGNAVTEAVIDYYLDPGHDSTPQMFTLFGDPALKLGIPKNSLDIDLQPQTIFLGQETAVQFNGISSSLRSGNAIIEYSAHDPEKYSAPLHDESLPIYSEKTVAIKNGRIETNLPIQADEALNKIPVRIYEWNSAGDAAGSAVLSVNQTLSVSTETAKADIELSINSTDLKLTNDKYVEGETIFVDAIIHNLGNAPARNVEVIGFDNDPDYGGGKQFTDRTDWRIPVLELIPPHSSRTIRLRWDPPAQVTGDRKIVVVVDKNNKISGINRTRLKAEIPVHILTKSDPVITSSDWVWDTSMNSIWPETRRARLIATVTNKGEMDAENVVIQYYDYTVKIGDDILIPLLKYKESKTVETIFDVPKGWHDVHVEVGIRTRFEKAHDSVAPDMIR